MDTWTERFAANTLLTYSSAIALQLLVALAALLFLAVALLNPLNEMSLWSGTVEPSLASRLPVEWMGAVIWSLQREAASTSPALIAFGCAVSIWEVSGAVRAVTGALNRIYGVAERRGFVRRFAVSFALAVAVTVLGIVAAFAGGGAFEPHVRAIDVAERVVVPALMIYAIVALLVYVAPAKRVPWRWASAGSILIVLAWLLVSAVYADWLANVVNLRTPEGTLALVLSTVGYLYASAIAFLLGAQLDQLVREGGLRAALGGRRRERGSAQIGHRPEPSAAEAVPAHGGDEHVARGELDQVAPPEGEPVELGRRRVVAPEREGPFEVDDARESVVEQLGRARVDVAAPKPGARVPERRAGYECRGALAAGHGHRQVVRFAVNEAWLAQAVGNGRGGIGDREIGGKVPLVLHPALASTGGRARYRF